MKPLKDPLETTPLEIPRFMTGEVAKILDVPIWRLQKFLDSPSYPLDASRRLGKARGSPRQFSLEDVYRIGIAAFLIRDGFAPKIVSGVLKVIENRDLIDVDEHGDVVLGGILLRRGKKRPEMDFFRSGKPPEIKAGGSVYYVLDFGDVIPEIDRRIATVIGKKQRR